MTGDDFPRSETFSRRESDQRREANEGCGRAGEVPVLARQERVDNYC